MSVFRSALRSAGLAAACLMSACALPAEEPEGSALPVTRWDHRPEAPMWTEATLQALQSHGTTLVEIVPADIQEYCPGYATASAEDRSAFWVGLFSALAFHESTWNPDAVGGGGRWYGLVQIDPRTARGYGCSATDGNALKDGAANLSCAVRIASRQVADRGTVSTGMRDWGPFHDSGKRAEMAEFTRSQPYCQPKEEEAEGPLAFVTRALSDG